MYPGLTTADKGALIKLKESGVKITTIISLRQSANTSLKSNYDNIDIDLALAQIAEMESKQTTNYCRVGDATVEVGVTTSTPLTWNERINQMTVEEKAVFFSELFNCATCPIIEECQHDCNTMLTKWLNSPYTEGANK